jgi:hypothetical protein
VTGDQTVSTAPLDAVLLDFKAAYAGEIDCLVIGVAARPERVKVLGASPPFEDIDPGGIHRIGRDREVETTLYDALPEPWCLLGMSSQRPRHVANLKTGLGGIAANGIVGLQTWTLSVHAAGELIADPCGALGPGTA